MTEKQFYIKCDDFNAWSVWEKGKDVIVFDLYKSDAQLVCDKLNELSDENEQLKKEKESWKSSACNNSSFNSILLHELDIAQEQGYKLSDPFKKLMREKND